MSTVTLVFQPDGTGRCLYTEAIDLSRIGTLSIKRATRIEFDDLTQHWRVRLVRGRRYLFSSPSRQACLDWERQYLERQEETKSR